MPRLYSGWCNTATELYAVLLDEFEDVFPVGVVPGVAVGDVPDEGLANVFCGVIDGVLDVTAAGDWTASFFSNFIRISPTRVASSAGANGFRM